MVYAKWSFALSRPDGETGKTRMQVLIEIRDQTGITAKELRQGPRLHRNVFHVWHWFGDLSRARSSGFSVNAISWADMAAYFQLIKVQPLRWELEAIRRIDDAFLESRLGDKPAMEINSAKLMLSKTA